MTNRQFIHDTLSQQPAKSKHYGRLVWNGDTKTLFSYGAHYPLVFTINNKYILNTAGYSNTTAKHINLASSYTDYSIPLPNGTYIQQCTPSNLKNIATALLTEYQTALMNLRTNATAKKARLESKLNEAMEFYNFIINIK